MKIRFRCSAEAAGNVLWAQGSQWCCRMARTNAGAWISYLMRSQTDAGSAFWQLSMITAARTWCWWLIPRCLVNALHVNWTW